MIDKTQPPPGWVWDDEDCDDGETIVDSRGVRYVCRHDDENPLDEAHAIYAEESRPAVVDFAESVRTFLVTRAEQLEKYGDHSAGAELRYRAGEILAAARGERSLP